MKRGWYGYRNQSLRNVAGILLGEYGGDLPCGTSGAIGCAMVPEVKKAFHTVCLLGRLGADWTDAALNEPRLLHRKQLAHVLPASRVQRDDAVGLQADSAQ